VPEDPKVCAMLLCDHVHRDPATGKFSLLGVFHQIHVKAPFPATHGPFGIYVNLTNMNGSYSFLVRCTNMRSEDVIGETRTDKPLVIKDPLARVEFGFAIPGLPLPEAGAYAFQLFANDRLLDDRAIVVNRVETRPDPST
jgi:hypothetical protein